MKNTQITSYLMMKDWTFSFQDHEQEYMCATASSMEHCTGASSPGN